MIKSEVANKPKSFFDSIERILAADYVPTDDDITELPTKGASSVTETRVRWHTSRPDAYIDYNLLACRKSLSEMRKLEHMIHSMHLVIIVIDLASYDQIYIERGGHCQNKMVQNIALCEFIAKTVDTSMDIILLLNNGAKFKDKISRIPLTTAFPEYTGGDDTNLAIKHIVARLREIRIPYAEPLNIWWSMEHGTDVASNLLGLMNDLLVTNLLRKCGFM